MTRRVLASAALAGAALAVAAPAAVPAHAQCEIRGCLVKLPCFATPDTIICLTASP